LGYQFLLLGRITMLTVNPRTVNRARVRHDYYDTIEKRDTRILLLKIISIYFCSKWMVETFAATYLQAPARQAWVGVSKIDFSSHNKFLLRYCGRY